MTASAASSSEARGSGGEEPPQHRGGRVRLAVVPRRLDQQPTDVAVAGLGDPALGDAPEECSDGTRPHVGADAGAGEPVPVAYLDGEGERGQSRDPAQARQPLHHWCELAAGGHGGDLLV